MNLVKTSLSDFLNESKTSDKIYYHGRNKNRPYTGNYIYITDSLGYAAGYSDGDILLTYKIPFPKDKIFSINNKKHLNELKKYVDEQTINAIIRDSGKGNEIDWAALSYIYNDDYEDCEELFQHMGFYGIHLKEREGIDSIYIFDENNLYYNGNIDITTPENIKKRKEFYDWYIKDKNFL